jgi:predicted dithiol-disulfide oxidoreductase (DUF899 family)
MARSRCAASSAAARSCSSTTSCSGPGWTGGCPSCSAIADGFNGSVVHLENHDVAFAAVSRAPVEALEAYKQRLGWTFTWASSSDSDFNFDYTTSITEEQQASGSVEYNYRDNDTTWLSRPDADSGIVGLFARMSGTDVARYTRERPGISAFALENGVVYHTYSAYSRGLDALWGMYAWLDRAPKGRNEGAGGWWRRRDEYQAPASAVNSSTP